MSLRVLMELVVSGCREVAPIVVVGAAVRGGGDGDGVIVEVFSAWLWLCNT